jgi:hypothetical protein
MILMEDFSYKPVEHVKTGEKVFAFDENAAEHNRRKFRTATVTSNELIEQDCIEITFEDGNTVVASEEHLWMCGVHWGVRDRHHNWKKTKDLKLGDSILYLGKPWEQVDEREAGYLSGIFDGEGHAENMQRGGIRISIAQRNNVVLERTKKALDHYGFPYTEYIKKHVQGYDDVHSLRIRGDNGEDNGKRPKSFCMTLKALGMFRPERLIENAVGAWDGVSIQVAIDAIVTGIRYVGKRCVMAIGTSTQTLVANGLLSHNSPVMRGDTKKRTRQESVKNPYDVLCTAHYHSLKFLGQQILNGSVIGYNEFADGNNFGFEPPQQAYFLVDDKRGITVTSPVHCKDDVEPWETKKTEKMMFAM